MSEKQYVQVRNLTGYPVVYRIPEDNIRRAFGGHETKEVKVEELRKLYYQPGGGVLLTDFLSVQDNDLAREFGVSEDSLTHEYQWTAEDVDRLLKTGSVAELEDALDFAPEGIVDMIVARAVETRNPDINKREAIYKATGKNVGEMIAIQIQVEKELGDPVETKPRQRRVQKDESAEEPTTGRRVTD